MMHFHLGARLSAFLFVLTTRGLPRTLLAITLLALWSWLCFTSGRTVQEQSEEKLRKAVHQLALSNGYQDRDADALAEFAAIRRHLQLSMHTIAEVKIHLFEKEQEIGHLKESIYFYRKVMAPEELQNGHSVAVFAITVDKKRQNGKFPIELVLRKTGKKISFLEGKIALTIAGFDTKAQIDSALQNVYEGEKDFAFKYFQKLRGVLTLPADFQPDRLQLTVDLARGQDVHKTFAWSGLKKS